MSTEPIKGPANIAGQPKGKLDVKRFHLPGVVISSLCPRCSAEVSDDLTLNHLTYPTVNQVFEHHMCCGICDNEWKLRLILKVSLELA